MADDDWSSVKSSILEAIGGTADEDAILPFGENPISSIKWMRFGKILAGTLFAALVVGINVIRDAIVSVLASPFEAAGSFGADLIETLAGLPAGLIETAAETTAEGASAFGVFAWVLGIATVLAGLYAGAYGLREGLRWG